MYIEKWKKVFDARPSFSFDIRRKIKVKMFAFSKNRAKVAIYGNKSFYIGIEISFYRFCNENGKKKFTLNSVFKRLRFHQNLTPKRKHFCVLCVNAIRKSFQLFRFHQRKRKS